MPSVSLRRHLVALTLAALLTLPSLALAAPRTQAHPQAVHASFASQLWGFLQHLWAGEGMPIDPNGRLGRGTLAHVSGASGMSIDPDGRATCQSPTSPVTPSGDAGMLIDPDGAH